jgi:hypothetical protein
MYNNHVKSREEARREKAALHSFDHTRKNIKGRQIWSQGHASGVRHVDPTGATLGKFMCHQSHHTHTETYVAS